MGEVFFRETFPETELFNGNIVPETRFEYRLHSRVPSTCGGESSERTIVEGIQYPLNVSQLYHYDSKCGLVLLESLSGSGVEYTTNIVPNGLFASGR